MKLNELWDIHSVGGSPVSRHSMQRYVITYNTLINMDRMIALAPTTGGGGGGLTSASAVSHRGDIAA